MKFLAHRIRISEILSWNRKSFLAHRIRISEILSWGRKSFLAHPKRISEILIWNRKSFLAHRISEILPWDKKILSYPGRQVTLSCEIASYCFQGLLEALFKITN